MDFVALDFETANEQRASACEVSLVKVSGGKFSQVLTRLIKPHSSINFSPRNVGIHGITPRDVADANEFDAVFTEIVSFLEDFPLVAHNATFDISVLRRSAELYSLALPKIQFYCTRIISEKSPHLNLYNYRLPNVCSSLDIPFEEKHRAETDAKACAEIVLKLNELHDASGIQDLAASLLIRPGVLSDFEYQGVRRQKDSKKYPSSLGKGAAKDYLDSLNEADMVIDDDFEGKEIIFTGTLKSMERKEAQEKVIRAGATTGNNVTKKTSIVVVGSPYDSELSPGGTISGKLQKVIDLRSKGVDVRLITEAEFLELFEN